jgi:hypothetical protein
MDNRRSLWRHISDSFVFVKSLLLDEIDTQIDIDTPIGTGFLYCQVRTSKKTSTRYLVLKAQGGEATVFVPLDETAAEQLVGFIQESFLRCQPENSI